MDRVAVVTGAGRPEGIGFEVCRQLAAAGCAVWLTARDGQRASALAARLRAEGLDVRSAVLDVADDASVRACAAEIARQCDHVDILVNNAAATSVYGESPSGADLATAHDAMETTLFGAWRTIQAFLPLLQRSPRGRIVNVSSGAGSHGDAVFGLHSGNGMGPAYAVSKAALNALTDALAYELRATPILVNAVCPGFTATFEGGAAMGARPVPDGARSVVWAALLPDDGPRGGFFRDGQPLPW